MASCEQFGDNATDHSAGDTKTHAGKSTAGRGDGRVDPHHPTMHVNQRATAVSGIDGCVGLQEILIDDITGPEFQAPAPLGADDSQ